MDMEKIIFAHILIYTLLGALAAVDAQESKSKRGKRGFQYLDAPIAKVTDATEATSKLIEFTRTEFLKKEVLKVGERIYVAVGWALANSIMIEGDDGILIVDTTESPDSMKAILNEFREISSKPVKAIIFTHFHTDHITGANAIIEAEKATSNETIEIYAHETTEDLMFGFSDTYEIGLARGVRMLGSLIPKIDSFRTGAGIGPELLVNTDSELIIPKPTITYVGRKSFSVAGIEFELIHTPGETNDQTTVWLPSLQTALPGDNLYKTFPNLYTIRGSPARNAKQWYRSLDRVRELKAEYLVGSHTRPVIGKEVVDDTLLIYRDAIKYVHDQTLRLLNKGYTATEIIEVLRLPDKVGEHPHLQEHYGTVAWSIRGIFTNYLGWFSGDPKDLNPMTDKERASRLVRLVRRSKMSNTSPALTILREAQFSHERSMKQYRKMGRHIIADDKWALELAEYLTDINAVKGPYANTAKQIRISTLRALGSEEISPNGRSYYLTSATELETGLSLQRTKAARAFVINTSSVRTVLGMLSSKVNGLECQCKNYSIGLDYSDTNESYMVTLRNSVCDVFSPIPHDTVLDAHLNMTTSTYKSIKAEEKDLDMEVALGNVEILRGSVKIYKEFLDCFDPVNSA